MKIITTKIVKKNVTFIFMCFMPFCIHAQLYNTGVISVQENTDVSIYFNATNTNTGIITNDGLIHLHKNFTNNGIVDFTDTQNTGVTFFKGTNTQNIDGSGTTMFYHLDIENPATDASIQLQKEIHIHGEANLNDGVLQELANGLTVFHNNATHINTSDDSFVDNKVNKQGNEAFVFPIGDDNSGTFLYRMAAISAPFDESDVFSAEYIWQNSDTDYNHESKAFDIININSNEYWVIQPETGSSTVDVTLSWNTSTTPNTLLTDTSKLIIVRWDGSKWINEGGVADESTNTITTTPSGYGVFTMANVFEELSEDSFPDAFSPNNDGINETFEIPGLAAQYPNFKMKIYNRYGNLVYDYSNKGNNNPDWWTGNSEGRLNVGDTSTAVPVATYWYVIDFNDGKTKPIQKWLYLNK